ncbi:hypothetical protein CVO77_03660 [Sphingopyxis lindanitolerans]|uniref:Uncharacterized protein n=1 Tax=Sphingopyxis lindanitolerans TaxID=2054227 RepID=A0A2S8B5R2_9SPHN|nr:hypothetical protein [Sphingopyxis lindanitolerans]PQM27678.1 hypothetical protein CVO77_03660 [Sphingopyxis lindanitolerans]
MVERGEIDPQRAKRMTDLFDRLEESYRQNMGPEAASATASEQTLRQLSDAAALKRRQTLLQAASQRRARDDIARYRGSSSYAAIRAMMDRDVQAPYENVVTRAENIEFQAQAEISDFIEAHRRNFLGTASNKAGLRDVMQELHGDASGNPRAKAFADALGNTLESLRLRFNAAGGNIGKLRGWGITHRHDPLKVRRVAYEEWRGDLREMLDLEAMRDPDTGLRMTPARLEEVLRGSYESIRTNGLSAEPIDPFMSQPKLANARAYPRVLVFKDGDAWLEYQAKYGSGDAFTTIMGHIRGMSHDIASLERFGPNPDATIKFLLDSVDRMEAQSDKLAPGAVTGASGGRALTERLWSYLKGETSVPVLAEGWMERLSYHGIRAISGTRDILTSALLGSSPISAISDINTQVMARKFNGLPQTKVLWSYVKQLNPASSEDRMLAIRLGLGMRDASHSLLGLSRYYGETHGPQFTQVVADDVLRLAGLNKLTEAGQRAFGLDFLGTLGDLRGKAFDALPDPLRVSMSRYGIDASDWDIIRKAEPERRGNAAFVNARNIEDRRVADRVQEMILAETARAVQENTASARALMQGGTRPGTLTGEFLRNSFQFKGFAVSLLMSQAQVLRELGPYRAGAYGAQFFIGMTLFGAASIQLREIAKGRDPRPMDNAEFWGDAALQGGGLGIFGDIVGSFKSDRIDSLAGFALGPFYGLVKDTRKAVTGTVNRERKDGGTTPGNPAREAVRFLKRYAPGGNIWYLRAAYERMILDRLSEAYDPDYSESEARVMQWAAENGQGLWWEPGDSTPSRAPDLANAFSGENN